LTVVELRRHVDRTHMELWIGLGRLALPGALGHRGHARSEREHSGECRSKTENALPYLDHNLHD